jgi:hypothetical protein
LLIFGYPLMQAIAPASKRLTLWAFLSIAWLLVNWWPTIACTSPPV